MPTKRRRLSRGRTGALSMDSFDISHLLDFMAGWFPPKNELQARRSHWRTWQEYMSDWVVIREECLASEPFRRGGANFAEQLYQVYGAKGPPNDTTYDEVKAAIAAAEDKVASELLADVDIG